MSSISSSTQILSQFFYVLIEASDAKNNHHQGGQGAADDLQHVLFLLDWAEVPQILINLFSSGADADGRGAGFSDEKLLTLWSLLCLVAPAPLPAGL